MAKLGEKYEAMVVFSVKNGEEQVQNLVAKFTDLIKANGELINVEKKKKRKLAYPINYESDGYYVVYTFTGKTDFPAEFERIVSITDGVLRSMVVIGK